MRRRTSKLALVAGFVAVLALAIGLVQLTRSATQAAAPLPAGAPEAPTSSAPIAEPPVPVAPPIAAREPRPAAAQPRRPTAAPAEPPKLAPAPVGFGRPELKRDADGRPVPIVPLAELRAQVHRTDAAVAACIARSGPRATGKATLSFTVAARNGKLVVETTGVQDEETLAGYPELLECMHRTANALALDGPVPELGTPIYVRRHVRIEDGVLAENAIFNFSYNP